MEFKVSIGYNEKENERTYLILKDSSLGNDFEMYLNTKKNLIGFFPKADFKRIAKSC